MCIFLFFFEFQFFIQLDLTSCVCVYFCEALVVCPESQLILTKVLSVMCLTLGFGDVPFCTLLPCLWECCQVSFILLQMTCFVMSTSSFKVLTTLFRGVLVLFFSYTEYLFTVPSFKAQGMSAHLFVSLEDFSCLQYSLPAADFLFHMIMNTAACCYLQL